jgi:general secretion pathway protein H
MSHLVKREPRITGPVAGRRGFTLVEVLMAIALIGVLSGTILAGSGMLGGNRMRAAAGLVMSSVRLAASRANATGRPVRIVFDLDADRLSVEETEGRMLRVKDTGDKESEGASAGAEAATDAERESMEYAKGVVQGPKAPRAVFKPVTRLGFDDDAVGGRELGVGVHYRQVQTEHDDRPRKEARAYLYFWPGGGTERAVVQLVRDGDDTGLSVVISPLTGRARLERGAIELESPKYEVDFDVLEEERE